ncbi:MAG: PTS sugar transporter subunit IIA [Spirochaetaceae bacterium]|jgi:PTS system nitrogen regulatory IIA component|nr:PTS sugar transporter subunit IIA [Spirochaetaceae bacterium]
MNKGLLQLFQRGGFLYNVPGDKSRDLLRNLIQSGPAVSGLDRDRLLEAVLERETLVSTAVGRGIALPHPRTPLIEDPGEQRVVTAFLRRPVPWDAPDGEPVHTALLIISASARLHLHTLSGINFLCQQEPFRRLLKKRAPAEEILRAIAEAERAWE